MPPISSLQPQSGSPTPAPVVPNTPDSSGRTTAHERPASLAEGPPSGAGASMRRVRTDVLGQIAGQDRAASPTSARPLLDPGALGRLPQEMLLAVAGRLSRLDNENVVRALNGDAAPPTNDVTTPGPATAHPTAKPFAEVAGPQRKQEVETVEKLEGARHRALQTLQGLLGG